MKTHYVCMDKEAQEQLDRAEMLAEVRSRVFTRYPHLRGDHRAQLGKLVTTRWDLLDTMALNDLPEVVQATIQSGSKKKIIVDNEGNPLITIYPDQRHSAHTKLSAPYPKSPAPFNRKGQYAKVTPVIAELKLINGLVRYQRMGMKRCLNKSSKVALDQFQRERAMASHILGILDQSRAPVAIARPLVIGQEEIFYEWWTDKEGITRNLEDATLTPGEYLRCIADAADGLALYHRHRIKFLDLNQANIAVGERQRGKLVDLGGARLYDDVVAADTVFTEPYYEWRLVIQQELHRPALDIADKYALGVLLRKFLGRYKLAWIMGKHDKRRLVMNPDFEILDPVLKLSDNLRASILHPHARYPDDLTITDPEYCDLATVSSRLRTLSKIVDAVTDGRAGLVEMVPRNLQDDSR